MKRTVDVVLAGVGLALASPLLLFGSIWIRLDSPGPVLFRQERVGRGGKPFTILKLRTMRHCADGSTVTAGDDARITRSGRWLRSTKVDELPQLINVLRGDMSLVGPRPELPRYVSMWPPQARDTILSILPGITDPASIEFRREAEELGAVADVECHYVEVILPRKVSLYIDYVERRSLVGDLQLLARTLRHVVWS